MQWTIGEVTITRIVDQEWELPLGTVLVDPPATSVERHPWLTPHFLIDDSTCRLAVQGFLVSDRGTSIVVDTCVGESGDEQREAPTFLDRLLVAGCTPEDIDVVVCTHMHFDHVGWNTRLVDGRWTATFPNARYLFARAEWDHWAVESSPLVNIDERVRPLVASGQAQLVETPHEVSGSVRLVPTVGHTPGHVSMEIIDGAQKAVITGDMVHHPLQVAEPEVSSQGDGDRAAAVATRRRCFSEWAGEGALVVGTHFASPTAGRLEPTGDGWTLRV